MDAIDGMIDHLLYRLASAHGLQFGLDPLGSLALPGTSVAQEVADDGQGAIATVGVLHRVKALHCLEIRAGGEIHLFPVPADLAGDHGDVSVVHA